MHSKSALQLTADLKTEDGEELIYAPGKLRAPFNFKSIIISPAFNMPEGADALLRMRVWAREKCGAWQTVAFFKANKNTSYPPESGELGNMQTDIFVCDKYATHFEFEVILHNGAELKSYCTSFIKYGQKSTSTAAGQVKSAISLDVEPISQIESGGFEGARLCSPTCVTMAANYYGINVKLADVKRGVYDRYKDIYGNWVLNTAYASSLGLFAHTGYMQDFAEVHRLLSRNICVAASIAFKEGRLKNAHIKSTPGHFVLIKGFDAKGNVIVLDPAAKTASKVETIYDQKQFASAWFKNKNGLAYVIGNL